MKAGTGPAGNTGKLTGKPCTKPILRITRLEPAIGSGRDDFSNSRDQHSGVYNFPGANYVR